MVLAGVRMGLLWAQDRRPPMHFGLSLLLIASFPLVVFVLVNLPSDQCPADKQLVEDAWMYLPRQGSNSQPPPFNYHPSTDNPFREDR